MATGIESRVADLVNCGICQERLKSPKYLPCYHTFCMDCIDCLFKNRIYTTNEARCPTCRSKFVLDLRGASALPKNFHLKDILDHYTNSEPHLQNGVKEAVCKECESKATKKCLHCKKNMCDMCLHHHNSAPDSSKHKVVSLEALMSIDIETLMRVEDASSHCQKHALLPTRYCIKCSQTVCAECYQNYHEGHKTSNISSIAKVKADIQNYESDVKRLHIDLKSELEKCTDNIRYLEKDHSKVFGEISEWFNKLRETVNTEEAKMKQRWEQHIKTKSSHEDKRKSEIQDTITSAKTLIERIRAVSDIGTDIFLISEKSNIEHWKNAILADTANLQVEKYEFIQLATKDNVSQVIAESAELNFDTDGSNHSGMYAIPEGECQDGSTLLSEKQRRPMPEIPCSSYSKPVGRTVHNPHSRYGLAFKTIQRNPMHTLSMPDVSHMSHGKVSDDCDCIQSMDVMSTASVTELDERESFSLLSGEQNPSSITFERENSIKCVSGVTGMAVTSCFKVIAVSNSDKSCYIFDKEGHLTAQTKKFNDPWDAATICDVKDQLSNVYVTDLVGSDKGKIRCFTLNHRGKTKDIKTLIKGPIQPSGITTVENNILFCDKKSRSVQIYDSKGGFIRKIDPGIYRSLSCPMYVVSYVNDVVIISDKGEEGKNPSITVISNKGEFLSNDDTICPSQIVVSPENIVFCSDSHNSKLVAFMPGETPHDLSIRIELNGEYDTMCPVALAFDSYGRLWVGHATGIDILSLQKRYPA